MLSDKDPMFGSASSQFNPLDNDDGLGGLSGALPCPPATPVKRPVGRPRRNQRVTPPAETVTPEASTTSTSPTAGSKPRGRPRKKPTNRQLSSFLIHRGLRGSQLKKELGLGGRVHIQDLDTGPWLSPEVVLRRLTVTVGGFRIELLPGPSYDTMDAGLQEGLTGGGEVIQDVKAATQSPAPAENQTDSGSVGEDVPLGLGPFVNPNDVQAPNGPPAPNTCSEETKADMKSASLMQTPPSKGKDVVCPIPNLPIDKVVSTNKVDDKDKLKDAAKALDKPKPRLPTVKNKSLVSRRPKSQIKGANPPPSSPTKPPQREDVAHHHAKPLKEKKGVVPLKRPGENSQLEHASKVLKIQTGKPAHPKPKSPGPSGATAVRKTLSCDGHVDHHDLPKHNPKPERPPPAPAPPGPPGPSSRPAGEDGGPERPKGKKPDKLLQRQKSKTLRAVSVEEPALFVPDNAPATAAAAKKEPADEQPAEGAWDGTNSCGLCKKHHGNMFMVGCGRCDDWFHGDCVGLDLAKVQEMEDEDQMYVCLKCCAEESAKVQPEGGVQSAAKRPAAPAEAEAEAQAAAVAVAVAEAAPEATGSSAAPGRQRQAPPQALASGGVRPMKKESDRRQSTEVKDSTHKSGSHQRHKGSSSAPKKPASVEEIRRSVRDSLKDILLQRLKESDLKVAPERASEVARKTERELFHLNKDTDSKYKSKYRSLMFNLRDAKNNVLFRRVLKGDISPANLSRMSPEELASKELAAWRQRENRHTIEMIEKDQREAAERRPITKITHKGEIEIESEEPAKAAPQSESPSPPRVLDLPAELLPLEQKAESGAKVEKDTTALHKSHLFDLHCKICTGRMAPPVEEAPTKVVKVATTVARRPSAAVAVDENAKGVAVAKDDDLHVTALEDTLHSATSSDYEQRLSFTSTKDEGTSFTSTLQCMWRGFVNMATVAKLVTRAFPVSGVLDHLTEDLPDSVQVGGRINPQVVWDYFDKIRATGTKEVCLIRFSPETEEDEISYTLLYAYFSSRKRFGVVSNNLKQVRDMYIIPLGATEKVPHQLVPFDGPGLESNRPNLLLGLIIRQRPKRDFLPVDINETAAIILPEAAPPPAPAVSARAPEAPQEPGKEIMEEEEEEPAAKKYLSYLIPAKKEPERPAGAAVAAEREEEEPGVEPTEYEASAEDEGEQGSESYKPLRFLPGVLLGWGGELPPLPDFGAKPPPVATPTPATDPRVAMTTAKSPRAGRFVIKKREPRPAPVAPEEASPAGTSDSGGIKPAARHAPGVSLREKPADVSTEAYLAGLASPPPNGQVGDKKEDPAAAAAPPESSADGAAPASAPAASAPAQTESPRAPLSILKKSSIYSGVEENCVKPLPPVPVPTGGQNRPTAGSQPAVTPLPEAGAPPVAVETAGSSSSPGGKTKDPRVQQVVSTATAAACPPAVPPPGGDDVTGTPPGGRRPGDGGAEGRPRSLSKEVQSPPAQRQQNHSAPPPLHSPPASQNLPLSQGQDPPASQNLPLSQGQDPPASQNLPPSQGQDPPASQNHPPSQGQDPPADTFRRASPADAGVKDHRRPEDRYSDPWERPRHADERDRDRQPSPQPHHRRHHHHADHHGDKKTRHRERSRHRGHSEERRKERYRADEHGGRHKERRRHRRDSDYENGRRSSRDSYS